MTFDKRLFAEKLVRCGEQVGLDVAALSDATGIGVDRINELRGGLADPSGDEILIFGDVFKIDFKFFVSGEAKTPFDQMEILYRKFGDRVRAEDRRAIAELLYLCDTEEFLRAELDRVTRQSFSYAKTGTYAKGHGEGAARALRAHLKLDDNGIIGDVFEIARRLGTYVYRRRLNGADVSGVTIRRPGAGACVLVNYDEDPYRQCFTLAHELGHVLLDEDEDVVVSFSKWEKGDLREVRANTFASHLLVPRGAIQPLRGRSLSDDEFVALAHRLSVNAETLARSMEDANVITRGEVDRLRRIRLPRSSKLDAELPASLTDRQQQRKRALLERGLAQTYVELCFDAYAHGHISRGRLSEALLADEASLAEISTLYGQRLANA